MELNDLYQVPDEQMYDMMMNILPPEIKDMVEIMFADRFGLEKIESLLENCSLPKEISDNIIRGLRWKYIQLVTEEVK
jgi:hypothetical protein